MPTMPGLLAKLIISSIKRGKNTNPHYIPREYAQARESLNRQNSFFPIPRHMEKRRDELNGIPVFWFRDRDAQSNKVVLYIHGGGFNSGSAEYAHVLPVKVGNRAQYTVASVEYRLAPENPFPAGLEDCIAVYRGLLDRGYHGTDIALMGDSAGGNLVFAVALWLRDHDFPLPAALCGISPVGALDNGPPSRRERVERDAMIGADFTEEMAVTYLNGHSAAEPYLSPAYGNFHGLPPIWMCVGTEEVFFDDALMLQEASQKADVPARLLVGEGMCHVYINIPDKESTRAIKDLRQFLAQQLGGKA